MPKPPAPGQPPRSFTPCKKGLSRPFFGTIRLTQARPRKEDKPLHTIQVPLLPFNDFLRLDRQNRLLTVLQALPAEPLLQALEATHQGGRSGYPVRVLWAALVAGVLYQIPTIAELRRHLETNPHLRLVCGLGSARVPSGATFSRFLQRLVRHQAQVDQLFTTLVQALGEHLPDLGQSVPACR